MFYCYLSMKYLRNWWHKLDHAVIWNSNGIKPTLEFVASYKIAWVQFFDIHLKTILKWPNPFYIKTIPAFTSSVAQRPLRSDRAAPKSLDRVQRPVPSRIFDKFGKTKQRRRDCLPRPGEYQLHLFYQVTTLDCCVFWLANWCSACRLLVEINILMPHNFFRN